MQDIQVYTAVLGLIGGTIGVVGEMRKFHNTSVINKRLDMILDNPDKTYEEIYEMGQSEYDKILAKIKKSVKEG